MIFGTNGMLYTGNAEGKAIDTTEEAIEVAKETISLKFVGVGKVRIF